MANVLVTGVTGQDGSYLVDRLVADGHVVHGLVHVGDGAHEDFRRKHPEVMVHRGDLRDYDSIAKVVEDSSPDEVYNLAAISLLRCRGSSRC